MIVEYAKNCVYANAEATKINCLVKFVEFNEELPFTADPNDLESHGREIFSRAIAGEFGPVSSYVAPVITTAMKASMARIQREQLLVQLDSVISNPLRWASMTTEKQTAWSAYRQALLDIPQQAGFPETIDWPVSPGN